MELPMSRRRILLSILLVPALGLIARAHEPIRLDQIQVIGSHNSYHVAPAPEVLGLVGERGQAAARSLDYTHRPLAEQFSDLGVRQIELDVFADPEGGRYADPTARRILKGLGKEPGPDPNDRGQLSRPGFKVFHIQDIDYRTTTPTLLDALHQVHDWSRSHPNHVPILVLVELKDEPVAALPTRPFRFGKRELDAVDAEIRSAFPEGDFLAPDDVRGEASTLRDAVRGKGWPKLDSVRGQVIFALDNEGSIRDLYLDGRPTLQGRAMFVSVSPDQPAAAWMKMNDPVGDFDRIQALVKEGFLVRTRADANTSQARANDPSQRDRALASGAQFISTDYPEARPELSPYEVRLPGRVVARPNPVSPGVARTDADLEARSDR